MNIQRFVWAATVLLFSLIGVLVGFALGQYYAQVADESLSIHSPALAYIPTTLAIGMGIVLARLGSSTAHRQILPTLHHLDELSAADRVLGFTGALLGLIFGVIVTVPIPNSINSLGVASWEIILIKFCIMMVCSALGMAFFTGMRKEMLRVFPQLQDEEIAQAAGARPKFLDTNIIIDGRLGDICKTGFIEGPLYVPQFVLEEVQHIADSSDALRRARGRRGLDVLNAMKELTVPQTLNGQTVLVPVVHVLNDFPPSLQKISAVDSKLVALARERDGAIITNDFNLNKVAELQGVPVLNLNELTQALKPVVLPGEEMQVAIVKEGKEAGQGVGYLEDGTMVVVGDGGNHVGETRIVVISSVYQTVAGKMIFADLRDKDAPTMRGAGDDLFGDSSSSGNGQSHNSGGRSGRSDDGFSYRSGGGMRRKGRA